MHGQSTKYSTKNKSRESIVATYVHEQRAKPDITGSQPTVRLKTIDILKAPSEIVHTIRSSSYQDSKSAYVLCMDTKNEKF